MHGRSKNFSCRVMNHQSDIIQTSGARRSLSSENPDSAGDVEENEDDEIEFKEPSPVKNLTSLRRTSRRTSSSSSSFTPMKMVKSPGEVTPKKTRKKEKTNPSKRSRGRPRKKKSSSSPEEESSVKCDDESAKYGELTIEVAEKKEEIEDSEEDEVTFIDEIFAESPKLEEKKKKRKQSYDWSENEVFSLIGMKILY